MDKNFGGVIWTNHALSRMSDRGIKQGDAWATWRNPEQSRKARIPGAWIYYKTYHSERIEVIAKKNERGEWIILSVWSRPVYSRSRENPALKGGDESSSDMSFSFRGNRGLLARGGCHGSRGERAKLEKREPIWKLMIRQILGR